MSLVDLQKKVKILNTHINKSNELGWYQEDIYYDDNLLITLELETKDLESTILKAQLVCVLFEDDYKKVVDLVIFKGQSIKHYVEQLSMEVLKIKKFFKILLDNKK